MSPKEDKSDDGYIILAFFSLQEKKKKKKKKKKKDVFAPNSRRAEWQIIKLSETKRKRNRH